MLERTEVGSAGGAEHIVTKQAKLTGRQEGVAINSSIRPKRQGLYDPRHEHDACGVGFIAHIKNIASHEIVRDGLKILENLEHRGAVGADPKAGDGSGLLLQIPDVLMRREMDRLGVRLPEAGHYGVGVFFMPQDKALRMAIEESVERAGKEESQKFLGWRDVPVDNRCLGVSVRPTEPVHRQAFVARGAGVIDIDEFERKLFVIRKTIEHNVAALQNDVADDFFYVPSFSARTLVYKGMLLSDQLDLYYKDLHDSATMSAIALVHQRFSTNTFPAWRLAHPHRMIGHNGEINTLRGNVNWMAARQGTMKSDIFGDDLEKLWPLIPAGQSDSAAFDNALEMLTRGGYSLAHAMMILIPEAWMDNPLMEPQRRAFYEYHAALMEPWDGPAAVAFSDGRQIGATLDRNGLRPARFIITDDDRVVMGSEVGVLPVPEERIIRKWRLQPGKMFLIDLEKGKIIDDDDIKAAVTSSHPYQSWLDSTQIRLKDIPVGLDISSRRSNTSLLKRQQAFGYTKEDLKFLMLPMAETGQEAVGAMGIDIPISVLSDKPQLLYTYFKQNFAQVTNPPIDPLREEVVMSLVSFIGPRPNLLGLEETPAMKRLEVSQPVLTNEDLEKIRTIGEISDNHFKTRTLDITFDIKHGGNSMEDMLEKLCTRTEQAVREGYNIIILSDRLMNETRMAIPALLATAGVHHHLIRSELRTSVGLVVETGEAREVHHFCCLAGYGAEAVNPWVAFETLAAMKPKMEQDVSDDEVVRRYIKAVNKGILKVMSKMGISTYQSYCGAQIFDAVGLNSAFVDQWFTGTTTAVEGIGLDELAQETMRRHQQAFSDDPLLQSALDVGGEYAFRVRGESHVWNPETVRDLQHAVRGGDLEKYKKFAAQVNERNEKLMTMRSLFRIKSATEMGRKPVALNEVEPAVDIVRRFSTGAMSFGSISREAHTTLAFAMNRIGGKSNTGEGGEEPDRFRPMPNGESARSAIKQVASGRFGVTAEYLANADMIQIKIAQGAKPGEGGQLPGHKVDAVIAKTRYSTPGVSLISPPPHHDIYSIEDLGQLIFDLKNVNPQAAISVKLVSEVGVGTVAAGVSKARADHVTISGYEGGTGASPLTSIKHAGSPWEIGLAETHQTLVLNRLRGRIAIQVDGGLRTGRDIVVGALLGADEFGFATAPLIAAGCLMMRKCHLNTCPVGIATQDPELRRKFTGQPEHVINYFFFVAEEMREMMAAMGVRTVNEMIGCSEFLDKDEAINHWKAQHLDFSRVFAKPDVADEVSVYHNESQSHDVQDVLDRRLIQDAETALKDKTPVRLEMPVRNTDRAVGAMLSGEIASRYGHRGLPEDTIAVKFTGSAGQSFGAFLARGVSLELEGDANDYIGKGLSGGRLVVYPPRKSPIVAEESIIVGNTVLYGAIDGECYYRGIAGERFAVRNSGAVAVVEGVGDHGCEYMSGGVVVVLGSTGRNFAAGMSGGIAYVLDEDGELYKRCNLAMVDLEPITVENDVTEKYHHQRWDLERRGLVDIMSDMVRHDADRLHHLITNHVRYTDSARGREILESWDVWHPLFRKVMPVDYRRVLEEVGAVRDDYHHLAAGE
ncbi:MAG: glutamate synthase large subunit [Parvularculales bacterium]